MTVWYHLLTILGRRHVFRVAWILALCLMLLVALTTTLFQSTRAYAAPGVNQTIGFQGRLLDANGNTVPDGNYNVQFKIYQDGTGNAAGNPDGTLKWTETYVNNGGTDGVGVKNGYMSVNLGSKTPFGTSVDWNQDTLWLSMNIAGSSVACDSFGTGSCTGDGEMVPMKRLTSTPHAINSSQLDGKTASNFVQLGQGIQVDAGNSSSIFINKTGAGNLIQLQNTATDIFTIGNTGNIGLGNNADKTIAIANAEAGEAGRSLSINAGNGGSGTGSAGGNLVLQGGAGGGANGNGGDIIIDAGGKTGTGNSGNIAIGTITAGTIDIGSSLLAANQTINIGTNNSAGGSSSVTIGSSGSAASGNTNIQAKNSVTISTNGVARATFSDSSNTVYFGNGVMASTPDNYTLQGTNSSADATTGGSLKLQGGNATTGNANGGNISISGGQGSGSGSNGLVIIDTPTFSTVLDDANCYTGGAPVSGDCTIAQASINNSAAVMVGFDTTGQTATVPDPTNTTAGRILYITAANDSEKFTLSMNSGGDNNEVSMRQNTTVALFWNGSDWTVTEKPVEQSNYLTEKDGTSAGTPSLQVGNGNENEPTTLLTLDKSDSAPTVTDNEALLGSMYYDTTVGKIQCYEADGWGNCSSRPDNFVTLSPEYSGAVINGTGIGEVTTDLCSDTLNINDGSSSQPEVCGANETYNFYNFTSTEATAQTKSIYVTYQLPTAFKEFVPGSVSLMGRTDSANSNVNYQIYKNTSTGLVACGSSNSVSTGVQTTWQKSVADGPSDPADCGFTAGDSIVFKINLTASSNSNAYVSNLNFAFSND